jgi:signal transduction histidine kinase
VEVVPGETHTADPGTRTYLVRDNGVGIPAAHAGRLFQAFRRLSPALAPGEGMGLVLVRRILDRIGGTIRFESAPGVGATFVVTLPAGPAAGEPRA